MVKTGEAKMEERMDRLRPHEGSSNTKGLPRVLEKGVATGPDAARKGPSLRAEGFSAIRPWGRRAHILCVLECA